MELILGQLLGAALIALALGGDLRDGRIANDLLLASLPLCLGLLSLLGLEQSLFRLLCVFIALVFCFLLYVFGAIGAGDGKLLALLAGIFPLGFYWHFLLMSFLLGALLGLWRLGKGIWAQGGDWRWLLGGERRAFGEVHFSICMAGALALCLLWQEIGF